MPVIPATQEAEAEELLEPRRWRLHLPEIAPLHRLRLCLKKREREKKRKTKTGYWYRSVARRVGDPSCRQYVMIKSG